VFRNIAGRILELNSGS